MVANSVFILLNNVCLFVFCKSNHTYRRYSSEVLEGRIVGGEPVKIESFPFTVKFFNQGALCSGTILNSWSVLTAAHCFDQNTEMNDMLVVVGQNTAMFTQFCLAAKNCILCKDLRLTVFTYTIKYMYDHHAVSYDVLRILIHENYNKPMPFACDIALIFVKRPIKFGKRSEKAILVNTKKWMNVNETHFIATGWGMTRYGGPISELGLMRTELRYVPKKECERMHKMKFSADMFCLYGEGDRDTCKGDSGGGVLWHSMVIGIVSHGDGCAKKDKPSLYANVWYFRHWIRKHVENFINNFCKMKQAARD